MKKRIWGLGLVALGVTLGGPAAGTPGAEGASKKAGKAAAAPSVDLTELAGKLKAGDPSEIKAALQAAKAEGKKAASLAPAVEELLRRGASADLVLPALDALGALGVPASSATIRPYAHHRSAELRRSAVKALIKTGGAQATAALREALSDADPMVRGLGASGLGALKDHGALADLFVALDHKVEEAAASIGQLCQPDECEKFAEKTGAVGLDVMTSGFDQILFRPSGEIPDDEKLKIVVRLRELGTRESNKYLRDVQTRWPKGTSPRVRQAIDQAVLATGGSQ
jgi:hypothetical protein